MKELSEITEILLNVAVFHQEKFMPTRLNFIYGDNGKGKSTIADVIKHTENLKFRTGKSAADYEILVQRYKCMNEECHRKIFQLEYVKNAFKPGCKETIVEMAMNGSGTRDTGRVLKISPNTATSVLKETEKFAEPVNENYLQQFHYR